MTFDQYIEDTRKNIRLAMKDCSTEELYSVDHLRRMFWEDDSVTGVASGHCTAAGASAADLIKDVLFDDKFLAEVNRNGFNMQSIMADGPDMVDVAARCIALSVINLTELANEEIEERQRQKAEKKRSQAARC